jgi:hypothetical protein
MYNSYIYSKDDVFSPFVKPPWQLIHVLSVLYCMEYGKKMMLSMLSHNGYIIRHEMWSDNLILVCDNIKESYNILYPKKVLTCYSLLFFLETLYMYSSFVGNSPTYIKTKTFYFYLSDQPTVYSE